MTRRFADAFVQSHRRKSISGLRIWKSFSTSVNMKKFANWPLTSEGNSLIFYARRRRELAPPNPYGNRESERLKIYTLVSETRKRKG